MIEAGSILASEALGLRLVEESWNMVLRQEVGVYSPSLLKVKPEKEWLDCLRDTSDGMEIESSPSSLS